MNRIEYFKISLSNLAEINVIALQSRFQGAESAELLQLNISTNGIDFHSIGRINGVAAGDNGEVHREMPNGPVTTKFIRLIPITDRSMPVCIRTELFGCYRHDDLESYSLSEAPKNQDLNLDEQATGVGKLADNITTEYLEFSKSNLEMNFNWATPKNLTKILLYTLQSTKADCLYSISLPEFNTEFELDCNSGNLGEAIIPLEFNRMTSSIKLIFKFSGIFKISEISWIEGELPESNILSVIEPVTVSLQSSTSEMIKNEYVTYAIVSRLILKDS